MKVIAAKGSDDETYSEIDLGIEGLPENIKGDIIEAVGEFLVEQTLSALQGAKSPVSGESFPSLSKKYKEFKVFVGGEPIPNLDLEGDLTSSLTYRATDNGLEIGFFDDQAAKADGHNKLSGRSNNIPKRRFLPDEDQNYKRDIVKGVKSIVDELAAQVLSESDLSAVESSQDLYDVLKETYGGYSKSEIREIVTSNSELMDTLIKLKLTRYL